jgi:hypothetical protein
MQNKISFHFLKPKTKKKKKQKTFLEVFPFPFEVNIFLWERNPPPFVVNQFIFWEKICYQLKRCI